MAGCVGGAEKVDHRVLQQAYFAARGMPVSYEKSGLPGPAVRLFDLEVYQDDETMRRGAHDLPTVTTRPEVEWVMTEACKEGK